MEDDMYRKGNIMLMILVVLGVCSLVKAISSWEKGKLTDAAVIPLVMTALVAEQLTPSYSSSVTVLSLLKVIKIVGVAGAFVVLLGAGLKNT